MGLLALLLWPARGLFAYTACALALYLLVVSVSLNKLAMYRRNVFLPFGGKRQRNTYGVLGENRGNGNLLWVPHACYDSAFRIRSEYPPAN